MNARVLHAVTGRLSLRPPQAESLTKLVRALDAAPAEFSADDAARLCAAMPTKPENHMEYQIIEFGDCMI